MSPPSAKKFTARVQSWSPTIAGIQESIPQNSEQLKQKLRCWTESLSKHGSRTFRKRSARPKPAPERTSMVEDLQTAQKVVAGNTRLTRESLAFNPSKRFTGPQVLEMQSGLNMEQSHAFEHSVAFPSPTADTNRVLTRSASASNLAKQIRVSVQRLKRSTSNASLRKKFIHPDLQVPVDSLRHSAPPTPRPNSIQKMYLSDDYVHPDQYLDLPEPLQSIAEDDLVEYRRPHTEGFRPDLIFSLHESRVCTARASPIFVEKVSSLNASGVPGPRDSVIRIVPSEPKRKRTFSQNQHQGLTSTAFPLMEQIKRSSEMADLRISIDNTRTRHEVQPLQIHQSLCGQAEIVATMYDIQHGPHGSSWGTDIQLQEDPIMLELVGPPRVGGRVTGKMWADGAFSRYTQSSHSRFSLHDHEECQCHNFKVWEAITDVRWRAIGLARTAEEQRWVVVLSE